MDDVYANADIEEYLTIKTHYEKLDIAKSNKIHYLQFTVDKPISETIDEQLKQQASEAEAG
jgi:tRNA (guanine-N7-)-methyltransferase